MRPASTSTRAHGLALVAAALALAYLAGYASSGRPEAPPPRPAVAGVRGHVVGSPSRELRPLTLRVGDELQQLGQPTTASPRVATVYLTVSGVPVVASFEVTDQ